MRGALLIAGTGSDAGKSVVVAGICRWLRRQGVSVAPFKAQNMALNSVVTLGGAEIGRAQAVQAAAAGVEPEAAMNPVLIKPSGERRSQVMLMGRPHGEVDARGYQDPCAGRSGSPCSAPSRICARASTSWSARGRAVRPRSTCGTATWPTWAWLGPPSLPVLVVGDIDRGGVFAAPLRDAWPCSSRTTSA